MLALKKRRTQVERSAATRDALIEATIESLLEHGYHGTTTLTVCRRANVTTGALQHQFGSKNDLILAVAMLLFPDFSVRLDNDSRPPRLPDRCDRYIAANIKIFSDPRYAALLQILVGSKHDPEMREKFRDFQLAAGRDLTAGLEHEFPEFLPALADVEQLARSIIDEMRGHAVRLITAPELQHWGNKEIAMKKRFREEMAAIANQHGISAS